jgi:hypothetical protein
MDALGREVEALKSRDPRRADIVNAIVRLSHLILKCMLAMVANGSL